MYLFIDFHNGQLITDLIINEPCRGTIADDILIPDELHSRGLEASGPCAIIINIRFK